MEISRPTKFLLEQGAEITATLMSSSHYSCPLVQGGLEIPCLVEVFMPLTFKNKEIVSKHKELIEALYQEKNVWPVTGSILVCNQPHERANVDRTKRRHSHSTMNPSTMTQEDDYGKVIRKFFKKLSTFNETVNTPKEGSIAILVD